MLIDFHTHAFPESVAPKALAKLSEKGKIIPFSDGTVDGLREKMRLFGVDYSVILNIATAVRQQTHINECAYEINQKYNDVIAFASVHPDSENPEQTVKKLKEQGFIGIKLHPDFMGCVIDDEKYEPILRSACENDMIVVIHAGFDFSFPDFIHATPDRILKVSKAFPSLKLVAAHMGSNKMWDEVLKKLCGRDNLYFDTSLSCYEMDRDMAKKIIDNHDDNRILFGSDMPWCPPNMVKMFIDSLNISDATRDKIYYKNAQKLLGLK